MKIAAVILALLLAGSIIAGGQAAAYPDLQSYSKFRNGYREEPAVIG